MKVLIGVDGSDGSFAAIELIGQMLSDTEDDILLYYTPPQMAVTGRALPEPERLGRTQNNLAATVFEETKGRLSPALRSRVETVTGTGKPAEGLLETAASQKADVIVVGARGSGPIERLLLGSVSRAVVHQSTLPVIVARGSSQQGEHEGLRVLLACDGSDDSRRAGKLLHQFTWSGDSVGQIVNVVESLFAGQVPEWLVKRPRDEDTKQLSQAWVEETAADRQRVETEMASYAHELPEIFHGQAPIVVEGHPSEQILATASTQQSDLVVVGARGLGTFSRLLIGSTSQTLLGHAPCSVLVVPQPTT